MFWIWLIEQFFFYSIELGSHTGLLYSLPPCTSSFNSITHILINVYLYLSSGILYLLSVVSILFISLSFFYVSIYLSIFLCYLSFNLFLCMSTFGSVFNILFFYNTAKFLVICCSCFVLFVLFCFVFVYLVVGGVFFIVSIDLVAILWCTGFCLELQLFRLNFKINCLAICLFVKS